MRADSGGAGGDLTPDVAKAAAEAEAAAARAASKHCRRLADMGRKGGMRRRALPHQRPAEHRYRHAGAQSSRPLAVSPVPLYLLQLVSVRSACRPAGTRPRPFCEWALKELPEKPESCGAKL